MTTSDPNAQPIHEPGENLLGHHAWQQAILDNAALTIIATDPTGLILTCNKGALDRLGYAADELVGRATPELIHDKNEVALRAAALSSELGRKIKPGFEVFVARACQGGVDENDWNYVRKDGSTFRVRLSVTAIRDAAGTIVGFLGIGKDITERLQAERRLRESEAHRKALLEALPDMVFLQNEQGVYLDCHAPEPERLVVPRESFIGRPMREVLPPDLSSAVENAFEQVKQTRRVQAFEHSLELPQGIVWFEARVAGSEGGHFITVVRDITERRRQEQALRDSEARFAAFMDNAPVLAFIKDGSGRLVYANQLMLARFSLSLPEVLGKTDGELWRPEVADALRSQDEKVLLGDRLVKVEETVPTPDGRADTWLSFKFTLTDSAGQIFLAGMAVDISERRYYERQLEDYQHRLEQAIEELEELASRDSLTGLKNRSAFIHRLEEEVSRSKRYGLPLSLLMLDVDRFKLFNDTHGHVAGDELLREVGAALSRAMRGRDLVARYGGEEFVIILPNTPPTGAYLVAERLRRSLESLSCEGKSMTASIGAATLGHDACDAACLIDAADKALYRAKNSGRNCVVQHGMPSALSPAA